MSKVNFKMGKTSNLNNTPIEEGSVLYTTDDNKLYIDTTKRNLIAQTYSNATSSASGLMSALDKSKLDGVASGANKTTVDSTLSSTSTNPVQNKVINAALADKMSNNIVSVELNTSGRLKNYGGFIDFHYHNANGNPTNSSGSVVDTTPDYTSRIIEESAGSISVNGVKFKNSTMTGSLSGNATTATKLGTARNLQVNLASASAVSFDGSANATLGVTGILPITNGGTGNTTGNAVSATKVNNNLIIKLNGGSTEGTNLFTFNGSSAKTINITPSNIGAYTKTETVTQINNAIGNAIAASY